MMKTVPIVLSASVLACSAAAPAKLAAAANERSAARPPHPKKGLCMTARRENGERWRERAAALGVSWHYSWGPTLPAEEPPGAEFVPMIWGYGGPSDAFLSTIRALTVAPGKPLRPPLLGFNEPDGKKQANLSVERALEAWPYLMQTGRRLGSPAAVHADGAWMREFMTQAEARGYRVDFVCVHWYGGANAQSLVNRLRRIHEMYGRPIWLTEFAVADWQAESVEQNRHKPEAVLRFMKEILPQLDALDFVERYAWFSASEKDKALGNSALFKEDGSLTELGRCYAEHAYARGAEAAGGQKAAGMEAGERVP